MVTALRLVVLRPHLFLGFHLITTCIPRLVVPWSLDLVAHCLGHLFVG